MGKNKRGKVRDETPTEKRAREITEGARWTERSERKTEMMERERETEEGWSRGGGVKERLG